MQVQNKAHYGSSQIIAFWTSCSFWMLYKGSSMSDIFRTFRSWNGHNWYRRWICAYASPTIATICSSKNCESKIVYQLYLEDATLFRNRDGKPPELGGFKTTAALLFFPIDYHSLQTLGKNLSSITWSAYAGIDNRISLARSCSFNPCHWMISPSSFTKVFQEIGRQNSPPSLPPNTDWNQPICNWVLMMLVLYTVHLAFKWR